jgi:hypothetical protein
MHRCLRALQIGLVLSIGFTAGCTAELPTCDSVDGRFNASYTPLTGNCGPISNPFQVPFEGGSSGVNTVVEMLGNAEVETELVMKGCTVSMKQTVRNRPQVDLPPSTASRVEGPQLDVLSSDEIAGHVTYVRYASGADPGCSGVYDASFTKRSIPLGGILP